MARASDFIEDGHRVHFSWDRSDLQISKVECPHTGRVSKCNRLRDQCVVARFVGLYGPEVNVGVAHIDGPVEIAWYPVPGECDLDREFRHIWVVPVKDTDYLGAKFVEANEDSLPEIEDGLD